MATTNKATYWSVTAFEQEIELIQEKASWPVFVKSLYGGVERCPTTGREHFQGMVALKCQQRMKALKDWLPKAHWEPARNKDALKAYAMKSETAIGEKKELHDTRVFLKLHDALMLLGGYYVDWKDTDDEFFAFKAEDQFWCLVNRHIKRVPEDISLFSQPQVQRAWVNTWATWVELVKSTRASDSITEAPKDSLADAEETPECNEGDLG